MMDAQNISAKYTPRPAHKVIEQYMCAVVSVILVLVILSKTKIRKKKKFCKIVIGQKKNIHV